MHDLAVTIARPGVEPLTVLFTHAALCRLEREFRLAPIPAVEALGDASAVAIEAVLLCGLEGYRLRAGGRDRPWTIEETRAAIEQRIDAGMAVQELVVELIEALTRVLRKGKAPATPAQ